MSKRAYHLLSGSIAGVLILLWLFTFPVQSQTTLRRVPDNDQSDRYALSIVLGLTDSLTDKVKIAIGSQLADFDATVIDLDDQDLSSVVWPTSGQVIAVGYLGCQEAVTRVTYLDVHCVLLTEENFRHIGQDEAASNMRVISALVLDQPIERQARVARQVYPALSRFSVLVDDSIRQTSQVDVELNFTLYKADQALAPQLSEALSTTDALIAIPVSDVFNRSTLRTVLLTAYGYGKPVIGLSQGYVKAGALITAYSTPTHVFRQIADRLRASRSQQARRSHTPSIEYPYYFSVVSNTNVARSLGLTRQFRFDLDATYVDGDFRL